MTRKLKEYPPCRARGPAGSGPRHLPAAAGADQGLVLALQAQARKAPAACGRGRLCRALAGGDRCRSVCRHMEAPQNISKYAAASQATACLSCPDRSLQFTITDGAAGFDITRAPRGSRCRWPTGGRLGGTMAIRSQPGHGTTPHSPLQLSARHVSPRGSAWLLGVIRPTSKLSTARSPKDRWRACQ